MAAWKTLLLLLLVTVSPSSATMSAELPGGGHVEVETGSRGQVCMYITDDWGAVESTQCTSTAGTYTLTGHGGGQARVTVSEYGGVTIKTGYFRELNDHSGGGSFNSFGGGQQQQPSEDEQNSVRFGSYENPRTEQSPVSYSAAAPTHSASSHVARRLSYNRSPIRRARPTASPTLPPVRQPHLPHTARPTFGPLLLPQGPPVTEAGLGAVEILASGPGQLTVFGDAFDLDSDGGVQITGPSELYPTPEPLIARKKRNRLSAASSSNGASAVHAQTRGGAFNAVRSADGNSVLNSRRPGHRFSSVHSDTGNSVLNSQQPGHQFTSVKSNDGNSVLNSQQPGGSLSSVQSHDGSSVLTSQQNGNQINSVKSADGSSVITHKTADGQRLGLVRSPDGSVVFSQFVAGRLVNVVRSSDGSSVVSTNIGGRQVTALTSPTGQRLIAGAEPGQKMDEYFDQVMLQLGNI